MVLSGIRDTGGALESGRHSSAPQCPLKSLIFCLSFLSSFPIRGHFQRLRGTVRLGRQRECSAGLERCLAVFRICRRIFQSASVGPWGPISG